MEHIRFLRKSVLGVRVGEPRSQADLARAAPRIVLLSRFFYVFVAYMIASSSLRFSLADGDQYPTAPLWPVRLVQNTVGTGWFVHGFTVTAIGALLALSAAIAPRALVWRLGTFLYLLLQVALRNSYGSINHGAHVLLYISFALMFLPRGRGDGRSREDLVRCLGAFWLAQTLVLLPYTLSGFWKIRHSGLEIFSPDALTRILLDRLIAELDDVPPLLPQVVQHTTLTQVMWILTLYVEVVALLVVFRPHLHRPFGIVLMLFHMLSDWTMNIAFSNNILVLALFLVLSPLAPSRSSLSHIVQSLPVLGIPFRALSRRRSSRPQQTIDKVWLVYDGECPLCSNYAQFLELRQSVGELILVDARQGGPIVEDIRRLPHDLNDGMVVKIGERFYIGHEALNVLARLSESRGAFNGINRWMFGSAAAARLGYPWLKLGRRIVLRLKGVSPIGESARQT